MGGLVFLTVVSILVSVPLLQWLLKWLIPLRIHFAAATTIDIILHDVH